MPEWCCDWMTLVFCRRVAHDTARGAMLLLQVHMEGFVASFAPGVVVSRAGGICGSRDNGTDLIALVQFHCCLS